MMKTITTLKNVMLVNALSSGATGLLLLFFAESIALLFGSNQTSPFLAVGAFLVIFAGLVYYHSRQPFISKGWLKFIITLDVLWVIESAVILFPQLFQFTVLGYVVIAAVALWVAAMALLQVNGLKQLSLQNNGSLH